MRVFKYRGGSCEILDRDLQTLANNQIFAASIESLNDLFEARVEIQGKCFELGRFMSGFPAMRYTDEMRDAEQRFAHELRQFVERSKRFGVYSLSRTCTDELLWAYYADSHRGFCIEYDLEKLLEYKLAREYVVDVVYQKEIPVITLNDLILTRDDHKPLLTKFLGTKSKRWEYEGEIRLITGRIGLAEYDFRAVKGLYFGRRCDPHFRNRIMRTMKGRDIPYFEIVPSDGSYKLEAVELSDSFSTTLKYRSRIAPVDEGAPFWDKKLKPHRETVLKAIEIVRREPYCERVTDAYISGSKGTPADPVFYVTYRRSDGLHQNYFLSRSEIEARTVI